MRGFVDVVRDGSIEGWLIDDDNSRQDLCIKIYINGKEATEGFASLHRPDLAVAGVTSGAAAFIIPFTVHHHHNLPCTIDVVESITGYLIPPGTINFVPPEGRAPSFTIQTLDGDIRHGIERTVTSSRLQEDISTLSSLLVL